MKTFSIEELKELAERLKACGDVESSVYLKIAKELRERANENK